MKQRSEDLNLPCFTLALALMMYSPLWGAAYGEPAAEFTDLPDPSELVKEIFLPQPPSNLRGEALETGASLSWDPPPGEAPPAYHVYRSTQPGGPYIKVNEEPLRASTLFLDRSDDVFTPKEGGLIKGQVYYYVVSSEGSSGIIGLNSGELALEYTPEAKSKKTAPPRWVGGRIQATARDTQVLIQWDLGKAKKDIQGYVIYRATGPAMEFKKLKKLPAKAKEYVDTKVHTLLGDLSEADFRYRLSAVLLPGKKGSEPPEIQILKPVAVRVKRPPPEFKIPTQFKLPLKSNLKIRGEKIVSGNYEWKYFPNKEDDPATRIDERRVNLFKPEQELRVQIEGTISERVKVDVNFDDSPYLPRPRQDISIEYLGKEDDAIQEVSFGDIQLDVGKTEFLTYNPGKKLFGLKGRAKILKPLTLSVLFAQTKGIPEQKIFQGAARPVTVTQKDISYSRGRYFYITKDSSSLPIGTGERIWLDDGNGSNNTGQVVRVTNGTRNFAFDLLSPGLDYVIDRVTGLIRLNRRISVNNNNVVLAVHFTDKTGSDQGLPRDLVEGGDYPRLDVDVNGFTSTGYAIIFDGASYDGDGDPDPVGRAPHYARNFYELNTNNILDPELDPGFEIIVRKSGGEEIRRTSRDNDLFFLDTEEGFLRFKEDYPFRNPSDPANEYAVYKYNASVTDSSNEIVFHYSFKSPSFKLDRINILEGSESVFVDGRRLEKGKDYRFDYFSGNLTFTRPDEIRRDSNIVVNYEYLPFLGQFQTNLIATRLEYEPTETFRVAGTYLLNSDQKPQDFPRLGAAPSKLEIVDIEGDVTLSSEASSKFLRDLTGLDKFTLPLDIRLSGEAAQSWYSPNTYAWDLSEETLGPDHVTREKGVLLVDTMEGIGEVVGLPTSSLGYFPSGAPSNFYGPTIYNETSDMALNNRSPNVSIVDPSPRGGHIADNLGSSDPDDQVEVLKVSYVGLREEVWDGFRTVFSTTGVDLSRTRFLEMWIKGDGNNVRMTVEIGEFSEDSNGNGTLDDEDKNENGAVPPSEDIGVPIYYQGGIEKPWKESNSRQELEDMDNDRVLDNKEEYFSYSFEVDWPGWRLVRVPVGPVEWDDPTTSKTYMSDTTVVSYTKAGSPDHTQIYQGRIWFSGVDSSPVSGELQIESVDFVGNLWQLNYDTESGVPGVDTNLFDATAVSRDIDPAYPENMNFVDLRDTDEDDSERLRRDEQALKLSYRLSSEDGFSGDLVCNDNFTGLRPTLFATRPFTGIDLGAYETLHLDIYRDRVDPGHRYGDRLVVRFEVDTCNYYQFAASLEGTEGNWRILKIPLNLQGGTVQIRGRPLLDNIKRISIGVLSNASPPRPIVEDILYLNNMRFVGGVVRKGSAVKTEATFRIGQGWISATHRYREEDTGFRRLDQSDQNNQHLRRTSWDFGSSALSFLGSPVKNRVTLSWEEQITEPEYRSYRFYFGLPDRLSQSQALSLGYGRALPWKAGRFELVGDVYHSQNRLTYDPSFLESQAQKSTLDQAYRTYPDVVGEKRRISPGLTYHFPPKIAGIGMGKTSVGVRGSYETESADYPRINSTIPNKEDQVFYRRDQRSREIWGSVRSKPFKKTSLNSRITYEYKEVRGNTLSTVASSSQTNLLALDRWFPYQENIRNQTDVKHEGLPGLTNTAKYKGLYHRAYYRDQVKVDNLIRVGTLIRPDKWISALGAVSPRLSLAREYRATAEYDPFEKIFTKDFLGPDKDADGVPLINGWHLAWINPLDERAVKNTRRKTDTAKLNLVILKNIKVDTSAQSDDVTEVFRGSHPGRNLTLNLRANLAYVARVFRVGPFSLKLADLKLHNRRFSKWEASEEQLLLQKDDQKSYALRFPYGVGRDISGNFTQGTTWTQGINRGITIKGRTLDAGFNIRWLLARTLKFNPIGWLPFVKGKVFAFKQNTDINGELKFRKHVRSSPENSRLNQQTESYSAKAGLRYKFLDNLKVDFSYKYQRVLDKIEQQRTFVVHTIFVRGTLVF